MKLGIKLPTITSHQFYALPLAIICGDSNLSPWIYSEFIQWHSFRNREDERMHMRLYKNSNDLFSYDPLDCSEIKPNQIADGSRIIAVLKSLIESEYFVYDFVDNYYIRAFDLDEHLIHDLLIYGYDDENRVLFAYAYYKGKLSEFQIPYDEYEQAYNSSYQKNNFHLSVLYRKKNEIYYPNVHRIRDHILDYLGSVNTYNREFPLAVDIYKPRFGLEVYQELKYNLQYAHDWNLTVDVPDMCCVYDHKRFMLERVMYLKDHTELKCSNDLLNEFSQIVNHSRIMVMLTLKLNRKRFINGEMNYINLLNCIDLLEEQEKRVWSKYYEDNRAVFENM